MTANKCGKMQFTSDVSLGVPLLNPSAKIVRYTVTFEECAAALGAGCCRFESCHSDQAKSSVNSFVCGTFSFIPAANVPMLGFAVFDFIRRNAVF